MATKSETTVYLFHVTFKSGQGSTSDLAKQMRRFGNAFKHNGLSVDRLSSQSTDDLDVREWEAEGKFKYDLMSQLVLAKKDARSVKLQLSDHGAFEIEFVLNVTTIV